MSLEEIFNFSDLPTNLEDYSINLPLENEGDPPEYTENIPTPPRPPPKKRGPKRFFNLSFNPLLLLTYILEERLLLKKVENSLRIEIPLLSKKKSLLELLA